jgi:hypothetical protein
VEGHRDQQRLHGDGMLVDAAFQLFVYHPLMRRVHVHHQQTLLVLRQDIDAVQLAERETQRWYFGLWLGACRSVLRRSARAEQRAVEGAGLCNTQIQRILAGSEITPSVTLPKRGIAGSIGIGRGLPGRQRRGLLPAPGGACRQRLVQRVIDELVHGASIAKTYLNLGRVHVDVHAERIDFQEQHEGRVALVVQDVLVSLAQRVGNQLVAHEAAVDEEVLSIAAAARESGRTRQPPQAQARRLLVEHDGARGEFFAEQCGDARLKSLPPSRFAQVPLHAVVMAQREGHVGTRQRGAAEHFVAVGEFGGFGLEELAPRRGIEIEVLHRHRGSRRQRGWRRLRRPPALDLDLPGVLVVAPAARQRQARHGGDTGQRLAAKTHAAHLFQVFQTGDLAGGVARQRQRQFVAGDTGPIVRNLQQLGATLDQAHLDLAGPRIQAVFQQFLEGRGGALHHLAGGDLVDEQVG